MDRHRLRRSLQSEILEEARFLGWVLLMMFVVVQVATR
jgi:hypothetical protein